MIEETNMKILIVDDDPVNTEIVSEMLSESGYTTIVSYDGPTGIEMAVASKPDLIVLDINMEGMNGIEACRMLKTDDTTKDIPVVFITASTKDSVLQEAFDVGGTDYFRKPVSQIELLARIKSALTQKKLMEHTVEKEKFKGVLEMAGAVCHELNQPLHACSMALDLMLMDVSKGRALSEIAQTIRENVYRMGKITKKLMQITEYKTKNYVYEGKKIVDIDKASANTQTLLGGMDDGKKNNGRR